MDRNIRDIEGHVMRGLFVINVIRCPTARRRSLKIRTRGGREGLLNLDSSGRQRKLGSWR
jgi:hypothetical protein